MRKLILAIVVVIVVLIAWLLLRPAPTPTPTPTYYETFDQMPYGLARAKYAHNAPEPRYSSETPPRITMRQESEFSKMNSYKFTYLAEHMSEDDLSSWGLIFVRASARHASRAELLDQALALPATEFEEILASLSGELKLWYTTKGLLYSTEVPEYMDQTYDGNTRLAETARLLAIGNGNLLAAVYATLTVHWAARIVNIESVELYIREKLE